MKTVILLIDFTGHQALSTDPHNDNIRYSALTEIISSGHINKKECVFYSTTIPETDFRLLELKRMAENNGFKFIIPTDDEEKQISIIGDSLYSISYIKSKFLNFNINIVDTQIIVTGTNTSGCVFKNKDIGAYHWSKAGYETKIYLPMCAEFEKKGINDFERNMLGVASLYKKIYKEKCFDIKICEDINDLNLPV